eukprot:CAMPEP_0197047586 /NCGR_PEP_ID=MMETSP1384-20130603/23068_1 /TAXON_ID=29189 /ORGANISM="Ammonia sp." /LENGTH=36 /DNA_ID= /DNA_START= /DNA_END= /DNA_ORIENTATION=
MAMVLSNDCFKSISINVDLENVLLNDRLLCLFFSIM